MEHRWLSVFQEKHCTHTTWNVGLVDTLYAWNVGLVDTLCTWDVGLVDTVYMGRELSGHCINGTWA
jgi:hypothetical protein